MIPLSQAHPPSGLQLPLTLRWRQCRNLPCRMWGLDAVSLKQSIFVGGGATHIPYDDDAHTVYEYRPQEDRWLRLPQYECVYFSMTILNQKLILVGGLNASTLQETNQVAVWETEGVSQGWTHPYPPMITPRDCPAIATYDRRLVVAGGRGSGDYLATVEVLDTTSHQWLSTSPLPMKCCDMTSAIIQDELFLLGGTLTTEAFVVSLPNIMHTNASSATTKTSNQWRTLLPPPLEWSTAIALQGSLLAIGGRHHGNHCSTAIHLYQPSTNSWHNVGDLPTPRTACSCALLPSGEILVVGGLDSNGKQTGRVDAAAL